MTNSNDFRRYSYAADYETANAVHAFSQTRSSAAPKYAPEPPKPKRERLFSINTNTKRKSNRQLVAEQRYALRQIIVIVTALSVTAAMFFAMLHMYALKNEYVRQIALTQTEISREESQYICTSAKLESLVTIEQIEDYAVNNLGMVKLQTNQKNYIDVEGYRADRVAQLREQSPAALAEQVGQ